MKNKTTLTITTINGSKSYTLDQMIKGVIKYLFFGFIIVLFIGAFTIWFLLGEMKNYQALKDQYKTLLITNSDLEMSIQEKKIELNEISEKITDIESLIGMTPQSETPKRARLDIAKISASERKLMLRMVPSGMPLEFKGFTSNFGWRFHPLRRTQREFHTGLDLRARVGTPVYASADGIVELVRTNQTVGYGNLVTLSHAVGFKTLYAHLDRVTVNQGEFVQKGQLIAYSGNTGYSSGPHLHYEVRYLNKPLDPLAFVEWDLKEYESIFDKEKKVQWDSVIKGIKWQWTLLEQLSSQREPRSQELSILSANSMSTDKSMAQ